MKKIFKALILCLLPSIMCLAQNDTVYPGFNSPVARQLLQKQFAMICTPQLKNNMGNYAALDIQDARADFSGNILLNSGNVIGIKLNGGVTEGVVGIFGNNKWSPNVGFDVQYNFLPLKKILSNGEGKNSITYDVDQLDNYNKKIKDAQIRYNLRDEKHLLAKKQYQLLKFETENKIQTIEAELTQLKKGTDSVAIFKKEIDLKKTQIDLAKFQVVFDSINELTSADIEYKALKIRNKINFDAQSSIEVEGFRAAWFSIGFVANYNSFKHFDPLANVISTQGFLTHKIRVQYSIYRKDIQPRKSRFISFWFEGSTNDNFSSLTKNEINEEKQYGSVEEERKTNSKYTAYSGDYQKNINVMSFGLNAYLFVFDNSSGIHISPEYKIMINQQPETNFELGFYMPFKNVKKDNEIINAELYLNMINLFETNGVNEHNLLKRSEYGIRFSFPINFN